MKTLKLKKDSTALVVVAHPDDEIIWMGGLIKKSQHTAWTIFSLCRASDQDREPKFHRVCAHCGAEGIISDLEDEDELSVEDSVPEIKKLICEKIANKKFDYIFTHGANGDYGHPRHVGVHLAVKELLKAKKLNVKNVFYFNYERIAETGSRLMDIAKNTEYIHELSDEEYKEKRRIVAEMYGYPPDGIDVSLSTNPEAFITK